MAFQFGFGHEDDDVGTSQTKTASSSTENMRPVQEHLLKDLLATLPSRISYSTTIRIESPTGKILHLAKRDHHDVRMQLLSENGSSNDEIVDSLSNSDIRAGIYEGGFKTWECSQDLASLLLDRGPRKDIDELIRCGQIIELGAGTALPTLTLFHHALQNTIPMTFVLQDYNDFVLRLVTLPNLLLTWASTTTTTTNHNNGGGIVVPHVERSPLGDLEITESLVQSFLSDLDAKGISLLFISGPWSPSLAHLIPPSSPDLGLVVLAAETIYSPTSTTAFVDLLSTLLRRVKMAKAMIGAKRVYFGVGGSVDGLKEACREKGMVAYEIENHGVPGMDGGVGRTLVEVQMY